MASPKVEPLSKILTDLAPAYSQLTDVINQRQAAIPGQIAAGQQQLEATKTNEFHDIADRASGAGMSWTGAPLVEQQRYLGEQYLPSLAALSAQGNETALSLLEMLAELEKEKRLGAYDIRAGQQSTYDQYLQTQEERAWQTAENEKDRALQRGASSYGGGGSPDTYERDKYDADSTGMVSMLESYTGDDGKVSPDAWNKALTLWTGRGYSANSFYDQFGGYINTSHAQDYGLKAKVPSVIKNPITSSLKLNF